MILVPKKKDLEKAGQIHEFLVGGFSPTQILKKLRKSNWKSSSTSFGVKIQNIAKYLKPPPRFIVVLVIDYPFVHIQMISYDIV